MQQLAELPSFQNSYVDSALVEGKHYGYYVQCKVIGNNGKDLGTLTSIVTVHYHAIKMMPPNNVVAAVQTNGIALSWANPLGIPLTKIRIYRAKAGEELALLKELSANESEFVDTTATADTTYFYSISVLNSREKESIQTDPIGVRRK